MSRRRETYTVTLGRGNMKKVKVILQNKKDDCGICCAMMILRYYGYYIKEYEISSNEVFHAVDGMSSMLDIKKCVEYYGLKAGGVKIKDNRFFDELTKPALLHWDFNHFVVFERKKGDKYYICNPDVGRECLTSEEFNKHFQGMAMIFEVGENFKKRRKHLKEEIKRVYDSGIWNVPFPKEYAIGLLLSQLLVYFMPLLLSRFISSFTNSQKVNVKVGIEIIAVIVAYFICSIFTANANVKYMAVMKKKSMQRIFGGIIDTSYSRLRKRQSGDMLSRLDNNGSICQILTTSIPKTVITVIFAVIATVYLISKNVLFTFILLAVCILISMTNFLLLNKVNEYIRVELKNFSRQQSKLFEGMSSLYFIKANYIGKRFMKHWLGSFDQYIDSFEKRNKIVSYFSILQNFTNIISQFIFITMGFVLTLLFPEYIGDVAIFVTMATLIYSPITQLAYTIVTINQEIPNIDRILDLVNDKREQDGTQKFSLSQEIRVSNLSFRYPNTSANTLENVNLSINANETIAILGESGAGKTTLINILLGIEENYSGTVTYDGTNINDIHMNDDICYISQDNVLYDGNLVEYLQLFIDDYNEEKVNLGLKQLLLEDLFKGSFVSGLFQIFENGANLSGGQKQRLALLRLFLKDYNMLILDEPTSHLDGQTAQIVIDEIINRNATKIIITHDTRLLDKVDRIFKISEHKLVEVKEAGK